MRRCDVVARVIALANADSEENYPHYLAQAHAELHALSFSFSQRIADVPEEPVKVFLKIARSDPRAFLNSIQAANFLSPPAPQTPSSAEGLPPAGRI